jgi:hypothetical protein
MYRHLTAAIAAISICFAGCGGDDSQSTGGKTGRSLPQGNEPVSLPPSNFTTQIDNRYWPMTPGTRWIYREQDAKGHRLRVVVTVSSETKKVANGITARVVRDTVSQNGRVAEDTFDWYAQDDTGNLWYLGEKTAEYENGKVATRAGSWEAGVDGALPGIIMPASPRDDLAYRQEYSRGNAEDNGEILSTGEQVQVAGGHFESAVLTKDTTPLEPKTLEYKVYAPDVGPVLTLGVSGGGGREELLRREQVAPEVARAAGTARLGEAYP